MAAVSGVLHCANPNGASMEKVGHHTVLVMCLSVAAAYVQFFSAPFHTGLIADIFARALMSGALLCSAQSDLSQAGSDWRSGARIFSGER